MNPLSALFGRDEPGPPPDLRALLGVAADAAVLLVDGALDQDGAAVRAAFADAERVVLGAEEGVGLPSRDGDATRLPPRDGGFDALVLLDVVDRVVEPEQALRRAALSVRPGGPLLLVQAVAPDDFELRGAWNALARLRDARQTWTPTRRQVRACAADAGLVRGDEALWEESVDAAAGGRAETAELRALYAAALAESGLVRNGRLTLRRAAAVLRPR